MAFNVLAYAASNKFTSETVEGGGAVKGKNCTIESIETVEDNQKVNFKWILDDGTIKTGYMVVPPGPQGDKGDPGKGIKDSYVNREEHFIIVYDDDTEKDCGKITVVSGGGELEDDLTTAIAVGGISAGTTYEKGTPLETLFRDLLEPTLYPSFTNPSASLTYNATTYYKVGANIPAMNATVALNRGSINPAYGTSGKRSGAATGYSIVSTGADTNVDDSSENSGVFAIPTLTRSTKGNIVLTGSASYAAGEQPKDSKGKDYSTPLPAGSVSASKTMQFILPYYYGASNASTIADFTGLTESVTAKGQKTFNYTTDNQYMIFAYDSAYGNLKSILDGNGFETIGGWTKKSVTVDGFSYFVYVSNSPTTDTNAPFTFKY